VNQSKGVFNCRGSEGGDVVKMVMHACRTDFLAACEIITGEPPPRPAGTSAPPRAVESAEDKEKREAEHAAKQKRREDDENLYRQKERRTAFDIWQRAHPLPGSSGADYLALRGLKFPPTVLGRKDRLRCVESMPYFVHRGRDIEVVHRGPALVAPIVDAARKFRGLHLTYLDLNEPKGKLRLKDPKTGEPLDPKKTRGSVVGNVVDLIGPAEPEQLILGEGTEKVIAVWMALEASGRDLTRTGFRSAINLGNLGGKHSETLRHPSLKNKSGGSMKVPGFAPDMNAPAIVIPDSVTDLVLLGDSTSDQFTTNCAMARAAARYARAGRTVRVAWAPDGKDFDDLLREAA
jgi:hypothetical protein